MSRTLKKIAAILITYCFSLLSVVAQNDTMYIMRQGAIWGKYKVSEIDSVIFYNPSTIPNPLNINYINVPGGTFAMGSQIGEPNRNYDETQYSVTLSAFFISKYEITNSQYAAFLNNKGIDSNGIYAAGAYPTETLIYPSDGNSDWGLHYTGGQWVPVAGYENHPVIYVTWFGAKEFATFVGGNLPTEAQWEYAARATTTSAFNTGACLNNTQANYDWSHPQAGCSNTITVFPDSTQVVGNYPANAWGLHDMHGNVWEWCANWYGTYPTTAQTNPTGPVTGSDRVYRGGAWGNYAQYCRSAYRGKRYPGDVSYGLGFRVVLAP